MADPLKGRGHVVERGGSGVLLICVYFNCDRGTNKQFFVGWLVGLAVFYLTLFKLLEKENWEIRI